MRIAVPLIALMLAAGAAAETLPPVEGVIAPAPDSQLSAPQGRVPCRDTIHQVREERGLPRLERDTASPEPPQMIAAVDHRIDGCSVMVMHGNTSDVRPLPAIPEGPPRLQRIPRR